MPAICQTAKQPHPASDADTKWKKASKTTYKHTPVGTSGYIDLYFFSAAEQSGINLTTTEKQVFSDSVLPAQSAAEYQ